MKENIRQLIGEGRLEDALKLLAAYFPDEVLLQQGRLAGLNRQNNMGLLDYDEYSRKQNQISAAMLDLIKNIPDNTTSSPPQPTAPGEVPAVVDQPVGGPDEPPAQAAIYFSYAWGDSEEPGESREEVINRMYDSLKADGFMLKRDKMDLEYKGFISEFMKEIGRSGLIVVAISDKYLRSPYCMHELYEIYRNSRQEKVEFSKRVFPIRVESIKMSDPLVIDTYLSYWEEQETKWKTLVEKRASQLSPAHFEEFNKVREINSKFSELMAFLQDMNSMTKKLLAENDFALVKDAIKKRVSELAG